MLLESWVLMVSKWRLRDQLYDDQQRTIRSQDNPPPQNNILQTVLPRRLSPIRVPLQDLHFGSSIFTGSSSSLTKPVPSPSMTSPTPTFTFLYHHVPPNLAFQQIGCPLAEHRECAFFR
ncbi:hypothetical protein Peur_035543 [Populus x canadensis]